MSRAYAAAPLVIAVLHGAPGHAAPGVQLDPALAELPVEASLTIGALQQLATGDKARVQHALLQLEVLLALPGFRGDAVTEALETHGGLKALEDAAPAVKGKSLQELRQALEDQVRARLGGDLDQAATAEVTEAAVAEQPPPAWNPVSGPRGLWRVPLAADRELEVRVDGCAYVTVRLFDEHGTRLGAKRVADGFTPARLWAPADVRRGVLRVDGGDSCDARWQVAIVSRETTPALPATGTDGAPVPVEVGRTYRVIPRGEDVHVRFPVTPGGVYVVRTSDLEGHTDTRLTLTLPRGERLTDDDGGEGLASTIRFDVLEGGEVGGVVELARASSDSAFRLSIEQVFAYEVTAPVRLGDSPWTLSPSAWSGHVVPLSLEHGEGVIRFEGSEGAVFSFHTALDVHVTGPDEVSALRLLGDDATPPWAVRPVRSFLGLTRGTFEAHVSRPADLPEDEPVFFQVITSSERHPTPHVLAWGSSVEDALEIVPTDEERFDGGVLHRLPPGGSGWLRFPVEAGVTYTVHVEGSLVDDALTATLLQLDGGQVLAAPTSPEARPTVRVAAARADRWAVQVRNLGTSDAWVRAAVTSELPYSGLHVGDRVKLGRHRAYRGETNWTEPMERYVGRSATVMERVGIDASGAWVVHVDIDDGEWAWRTRDLDLVARVRP